MSDETDETRRLLRESAADFVARADVGANVRPWRRKAPGYDRARWREMAELGWVGLRIPEEFGGSALGVEDAVALYQETGRGIGPEPLSAVAILAARTICGGDNPAAKAALLGALADGSRTIAVAWQEHAGAMEAADAQAKAEADGEGYVVSGTKDYVHGGAAADGYLVSARARAGVGLFYVARDARGLSVETRFFTDGAPCVRIALAGVKVGADDVVAAPGRGEAALDAALDEARIVASAEMLGLSRAALDITLDYLRQRKQFGKAIGSFQALQHRAVDLYVTSELMRSAIDRAARGFEAADARERALIASACKARCSDGALAIAKEAIQMHGAIGYTDEHVIGLYVRRALVLSAWLGNGAQHRKRFAALSPALDLV